MIGLSAMEYHHALQIKWPPVSTFALIRKHKLSKTRINRSYKVTPKYLHLKISRKTWLNFCGCRKKKTILSHPEFSLSAYKRNKRKMELAEKMDTGHNQTKKRRQSSENVSDMLSVKILTVVSIFFLSCVISILTVSMDSLLLFR